MAYDTPIAEKIMAALAVKLQAIKRANGYYLDVSDANVERKMLYSVADNPALPSIYLVSDDIEPDDMRAAQ